MNMKKILVVGCAISFSAIFAGASVVTRQQEFNALVKSSTATKSFHMAARHLITDSKVDPSLDDNALLIQAVRNNDFNMVRLLLEDSRVKANAKESLGLEIAVMQRNYEMIFLLLCKGADPRAREFISLTKAFLNHDTTAVNLLLNDNRIVFDNHLLFAALKSFNGHFRSLELLIDHGKFHSLAKKRLIPIALILNKIDLVNWLVNTLRFDLNLHGQEKGAFLQALQNGYLAANANYRVNAAFSIVVRELDYDMVDILLKRQIGEPNPEDLIFAVTHRKVSIVRLLLEDGRLHPSINDGWAIRKAVLNLDIAMIRLFLEDERIDFEISSSLFYPPYLAIVDDEPISFELSWKSLKMSELILKHGKVKLPVLVSWLAIAMHHHHLSVLTLLQCYPAFNPYYEFIAAMRSGNQLLCKLFLNTPLVNPSANFNEALNIAICRRDEDMVDHLMKSKTINPNDRNGIFLATLVDFPDSRSLTLLLNHPDCNPSVNNNFALRLAIRKKDLKMVKKILCLARMKKVDPNIPIYDDSTPLYLAVQSGQKEVVEYLLSFPKYFPMQYDLCRAFFLAKRMNLKEIETILEKVDKFQHGPVSNSWSFTVDPAMQLVWIKGAIVEIHSYLSDRDLMSYIVIKPIEEMVHDILSNSPPSGSSHQSLVCFEPLKLAYEDFMMSRPKLSEPVKKEIFVRIMTTDYLPPLQFMPEPEVGRADKSAMAVNLKRNREESEPISPNHEEIPLQTEQTESEAPPPKRRRASLRAAELSPPSGSSSGLIRLSGEHENCNETELFAPNSFLTELLEVAEQERTQDQ